MDKINESIKNKIIKQERRTIQLDNNIHYENMTVYPLPTNGFEGAVIRIDDITEQVFMEEMMIQNEKMLSIGGLAAGMAHEINNPIGGILQAVQNIQRRLSINLKKMLKQLKN